MPQPTNVIDQMLALTASNNPVASDPVTPFEHAFGTAPLWTPDYQRWDYMQWGWFDDAQTIWPVGAVKIEVILKRQIHAPKARGRNGSRITDSGKLASSVRIEIMLWRIDHFAAFELTVEKYAALKQIQAGQAAIKILHPETRRAKIDLVVIKEIRLPVWQSAAGVAKATMECLEYITPPKRAAAGPTRTVVPQLPQGQQSIDRQGAPANRSVEPPTPSVTESAPNASRQPTQTLASF